MILRKDGIDVPVDKKNIVPQVCIFEPVVKNNNAVNHPSHYETGKFECIDVMLEVFGKEKVMAFCQCNAFKYLYRSDRKNGEEDLQKAQWYLNKYQELEDLNDQG